jgi:hypothetical protein
VVGEDLVDQFGTDRARRFDQPPVQRLPASSGGRGAITLGGGVVCGLFVGF